MKLETIQVIASVLNEAGVRFIVVGGLAVNAHGYGRATFDIDIVLPLEKKEILRAFEALRTLGYRPRVPITPEQFADPETRERFATEKGMQVLQLCSERHWETPIDILVRDPFDFDTEYEAAYVEEIVPDVPMRFVSLPTLIRMKEEANRDKDRDDVYHLRLLLWEKL